jgi:YVTN family beta-propeller protein
MNANAYDFGRECLSPLNAIPATPGLTINGDLSDWNFINSQVIYVSEEFFKDEHMEFAYSYDKDALYFAAKVTDVSPMKNSYHYSDRFWEGDSLQLRFYTKLNSIHVPLHSRKPENNQDKRIAHCSFYYQHTEDKIWAHFNYSLAFKDSKVLPAGVDVAFKEFKDGKGYNIEIKMPWAILNMEEEPEAGAFIHSVVEINFGNMEGTKRVRKTSGVYQKNPGDFGFKGGDNWGSLYFLDKVPTERSFPDVQELSNSFAKLAGLIIPVEFPFAGCATINIKDESGAVVREIVIDEVQPKGSFTFVWDGKDNRGQDVSLGEYNYEVLFYEPIKVEYMGSTASSGNLPYATLDGTGEWGGDHTNPQAVAIDDKGTTLLWPIAELGRAIVRMDNNDKVIWRYTPYVDASGNFQTMASDGEYIYLTFETAKSAPEMMRLRATDAGAAFFNSNTKSVELPIGEFTRVNVPGEMRATKFDLVASGLAVDNKYIYVSIYPNNEVIVMDKKSLDVKTRITVPAPRGIAVSAEGNIVVVSAPASGDGAIYSAKVSGSVKKIIEGNLVAPWNVAVLANGNMVVTDLGKSQQIKEFSSVGKLVKTYGKLGGRAIAGKYKAGDFLVPSGIASDSKGDFVVVENSIPSVISRIDSDGEIKKQWFGPGCYAHAVWPSALDPYWVYSMVPGGILRSTLNPQTKDWYPDAYWSFTASRKKRENKIENNVFFEYFKDEYFQNMLDNISYPQNLIIKGNEYMSSDSAEHPIVRVEGSGLIPVATCFAKDGLVYIATDINKNGVIDDDEIKLVNNITKESTKGYSKVLNGHIGSQTLAPSGNWFIAGEKKIYKFSLKSFNDGQLVFDTETGGVFIDDITHGYAKRLYSTYRSGVLGMREDSKGNLYVLYTLGGKSPGIGHSSDIKNVFLTKYDKNAKLIWEVGRKASSFAKAGEIYNPWVMAGILNDRFIGISDETGGMIHFYDENGFFRGKIFSDYARGDAEPGPYLFHGENFSGRVQYFPELNKYMAYMGMTDSRVFELSGLDAKTKSSAGKISLDKMYSKSVESDNGETDITRISKPLKLESTDNGWNKLEAINIKDAGVLKLAVDDSMLYFEFVVKDKTALMNAEQDALMAFKGGDAVDLYFGKDVKRANDKPILGDVRVLISSFKGKVRVVGAKVISDSLKQKYVYTNPGGYKGEFDFVGEIADAKAIAFKTDDGYTVRGMIPVGFFEPLTFVEGSVLKFDADILQSDFAGQRTVNRVFWHASGDSRLTMTQDVPTECYLYPTFWGKATVK